VRQYNANMNENTSRSNGRRNAVALAAALTVTIFTAVAAFAGFSRSAPPSQPVPPAVASVVQHAPALAGEGWDD
jgi:hypothetical protein